MSEQRPVESSAKLIAGCTLTSRITGLIRDMLLVHTFGLTWALDAFNYAFQIPNLFRRLFGEGALAAVFVPTFTHTLEAEGRGSAWKLLARVLALLTLTLVALILVIETVVLLIWLFNPDGPERQVIIGLTALMLPFMLTICVVALMSSILNCLGSFVIPALTPVILNLTMIAGIVWLAPTIDGDDPQKQIFGVAISVLVAGVLQLVLLVPVVRCRGVTLSWSMQFQDPHVREILGKMLPVFFGQGVLLLGTFLDAQVCTLLTHVKDGPASANLFGFTFTYPLAEGALSAVTVAQRLYQFPLGVLGVSLAVAALPTFSRLATHKDWSGWSTEVTRSLRLAFYVGLLTGGLMLVLAEPIVQLLFEYGDFNYADTIRSGRILMLYGLGMWAFCVQHIVLRGFYSLGDVRTPLKISCVFVPINLALSLILIWCEGIREAAFAISTSCTSAATVAVGIYLLRRKVGRRLISGPEAWFAVKMIFTAVVSVSATYWIYLWLVGVTGTIEWELIHRTIVTIGSLGLGSVVFLALGWLMRLPETTLLLRFRRRSIK